MKARFFLPVIMAIFILSCGMTQQAVKNDQPNQVAAPELKLRIEGVQQVKAEISDVAERALALKEAQFALEKEKWSIEQDEKKRKDFEEQLSSLTDIKHSIPVINLYSHISISDWRYIKKDLQVLWDNGYKEVIFDVNSGGGSAFAGMAIADVMLKFRNKGMSIRCYATGLIASAAVPIFAVGSERVCGRSTSFMVHEAAIFKFLTVESKRDIDAQGKMFELMQKNYIQLLTENSKKPYDFWLALEGKTTWFSAEEAKAWGIVDRIE